MEARKQKPLAETEDAREIRRRFFTGRFPVATVEDLEGRLVEEVLGLVVSRGYNSEETFFSMLLRAETKGAGGIIGYRESVAFHPDGSRFYTCYGTAVRLRGQEQPALRLLPTLPE